MKQHCVVPNLMPIWLIPLKLQAVKQGGFLVLDI